MTGRVNNGDCKMTGRVIGIIYKYDFLSLIKSRTKISANQWR